jgi:hypothetical protein
MKRHAGSGKPQGSLNRGTPSRVYANHGGTDLRQGVVRGPPQPRVQGGTFGMGTLKKGKRK